MNTIITSKEAILKECRSIVMQDGIDAINMRSVARACHVAVGSIYYYFPSKADLIAATIADVWNDIFHMSHVACSFESFTDCLSWLFENIKQGSAKYPGFFAYHSQMMHADNKAQGKATMASYFTHIRSSLLEVLRQDQKVRKDAFNETFTETSFIDLIFTIFTTLLMQNQSHCDTMIECVSRCIY